MVARYDRAKRAFDGLGGGSKQTDDSRGPGTGSGVGEARRNEISLNENSVARDELVNRADLRKRGVAAKFMRLTNPSRGTTYLCKAASSTLLLSRPL